VSPRTSDIDRALVQLDALIEYAGRDGPERNEAATRFDLIDRLLLNVLAWPRDQVRPEEHSAEGFADYVLGAPQRLFVVEAKKEGLAFQLPDEVSTISQLPTLFTFDSNLKSAVEQARRYAASFGLQYAAVSNGHQLVAFLAVRTDGVEPLKGRALAFPSLERMRTEFKVAWNGLSRPGVEARRLSVLLAGDATRLPPPKASTLIPGYPNAAKTHPLITDLQILGELFLLDVAEQEAVSEDFLEQCYLESGALSQHAAVGKDILRARYSSQLAKDLEVEIAPARERTGVADDLLRDVATASLSARPIVLLGYVGVGKSIFIKHLTRIEAKDVLAGAIVLSVDLGQEPALEQLEEYVVDSFANQLEAKHGIEITESEFVRRVYARDLERFRRSPEGEYAELDPKLYRIKEIEFLSAQTKDRGRHLHRSLDYLARARDRQIVTILDNVDQRPADVQDAVFLLGETLAKSWPGTVFVALRPDTFNRSKKAGTLSAYLPRVFAVSPPRIDRMLEKRIAFARSRIPRSASDAGEVDFRNADALDQYLEAIRLSLRRSKALAELVDNLSAQNARRALELLTTLVSSPHARPRRVLEFVRKGKHYSIPFYDVLKAVMLGDRDQYDPGASRVPNVFDISTTDGREHFLQPILISLLQRTAEPGVEEGYVGVDRVYRYCQELGFDPEQVTWQLERGVVAGLMEASPIDGAPDYFRGTPVGSYLQRKLLAEFTYIDEVSIDTPILDDQTRAITQDAEFLTERLQRADRFVRYLDDQWTGLADREAYFDWATSSAALHATIAELEDRADRAGLAPPPSSRRRRS
jgi:hypothetical protein